MKRPSFQFYPGDWMKDPCLGQCSPSTRGIVIDLLCAIHETGIGSVSGTCDSLSRICRCSPQEMREAVTEISVTKTLRVTESNGIVTLVSRRMKQESDERQANADRQLRFRERHAKRESDRTVTPKVTPYSSSSSSSSSSDKTPCIPQKTTPSSNGNGVHEPPGFTRFWDAWPVHHRKVARKQCLAKWTSGKLEEQAERIVRAVELAKRSNEWIKSDGQFIPQPMVWLNQGRWNAVIEANQPRIFVEDN